MPGEEIECSDYLLKVRVGTSDPSPANILLPLKSECQRIKRYHEYNKTDSYCLFGDVDSPYAIFTPI